MSISIVNTNMLQEYILVCIIEDDMEDEDWVSLPIGEVLSRDLYDGTCKVKVSKNKKQISTTPYVYILDVPGEYYVDNDFSILDAVTADPMPLCNDFKKISIETRGNLSVSNKNSKIEIENCFSYEVYIRLSGGDEEESEFSPLFPNEKATFERPANKKYFLEYSLSPIESSGFNLEVISGNKYIINEIFCMKTSDGQNVPHSNKDFSSNFESDDLTISTEKIVSPQTSGINIHNSSNLVIKVRISALGGGDESWVNIVPHSTQFFPRVSGHSFHLQYSLNENTNGPTVNVRSNETYTITPDFKLKDSHGDYALFSVEQFRSAEETENKIVQPQPQEILPNDFVKIFIQNSITPAKDSIVIVNNTDYEIQARISKKNVGAEDYFRILPHKIDSWKREEGNFISTIRVSGVETNFYLRTNSAYIYYPNNILLDFDGKKVTKTFDAFDSSKNTYVNTMLFRLNPDPTIIYLINSTYAAINVRIQRKVSGSEDYFVIPFQKYDSWRREAGYKFIMEVLQGDKVLRFYVQTQLIYQLQNDFTLIDMYGNKISPTYDLFENYSNNSTSNVSNQVVKPNKIKIMNNYPNSIHARVKACSNQGSEDLFAIASGKEDSWTRPQGKYLIEIALDKDHKFRYYVLSQNDYTFNSEKQLINNETKEKISPTQDNTFAPSWMDSDPKVPEVIVVDPEVPYYKNIKPDVSNMTNLFVDKTFPPELRIINSLDEKGKKVKPHFGHAADEEFDDDGIEFKRPGQIWGNNYSLFKDKIEYDDVVQGQIGNCYLISVIAALSKRPSLIESLFKTRSANRSGLYELYFYENGQKRVMFVDDHFVTRDEDFLYAKPNGSEIWVLLLEKAFAKYEGGYSNIEGGDPADALKFFTGAITRNEEDLLRCWSELVAALKKGHICCAGSRCETGMTDQQKTAGGIYYGHAYSITDAKEYNNGNIKIQLVQLRNPWGQGEWKGAFSDNSKEWTPELREFFKLDECKGEDGRFWMPLKNFAEEFDVVTICYC